jgi:hypothetical protein
MPGTATARAAAKPKPTPRRKPAAPKPVTDSVSRVDTAPEVPGGAVELGTTGFEVERETLFYVAGVGYTIPKSFGPSAALGYAHTQRTQGGNAAVDWAMERALGTVGYAVLREQDDLTEVQLDNMVSLIIARIEGLPDPKPKRS